ncbi:hypothetical protein [Lentibacillus kapialis]
MPNQAIAGKLHVSPQRISQMHQRALKQIKQSLEKNPDYNNNT